MAKKRKKKVGIPKSKIMSAARRLWLYSSMRKEAFNKDRTSDGYHRCAKCRGLTEEVAIDHEPSVVPLTGWDSWDNVLERLFCDADKLQKLCHKCHGKKSTFEANQRKKHRAIKKGIKVEDNGN